MPKPTFMIIGVPRAGTTSLHEWLSRNPSVFMSRVKEPGFFAFAGRSRVSVGPHETTVPEYASSWKHYLRLFEDARPEQIIGEATTLYFHLPQSPGLLKALLPSAKLVVILRHPVERAYSHYLLDVRSGRAKFPFERIPARDWVSEGGYENWEIGRYATNLKRYRTFFPDHQIHVCFFDDLVRDPASFYSDVCTFLGVQPAPQAEAPVLNDFGEYPHRRWRQWLIQLGYRHPIRRISRLAIPFPLRIRIHGLLDSHRPAVKPAMPAEVRNDLLAYYRPEVMELESMTRRDLSAWLK